MRKLAARDFEDILQVKSTTVPTLCSSLIIIFKCSLPVFEGLLPKAEEDECLQNLLYRVNEFHTLSKLRMHTDTTLDLLQTATDLFQQDIRVFRDTVCAEHTTMELPREVRARARKQAREAGLPIPEFHPTSPTTPSANSSARAPTGSTTTPTGRKQKSLNLNTYKFHALGEYASAIRMFGTFDSYSTQSVRPITDF